MASTTSNLTVIFLQSEDFTSPYSNSSIMEQIQTTNNSNFNFNEDPFQRASLLVHVYFLPVVIFTGLVGNVASSYAFFQKGLRNISSSVYVQAVLFSDNGVLISLFFVWLEVMRIRVNHLNYVCQFLVYWTYVCTFLSIWFVVCITVESYITICHPTRIKEMCTVKRATIVTVSLTIFALSVYLVSLFTTEVGKFVIGGRTYALCSPSIKYKTVAEIIAKLDTFGTLLIPLALISLMLIAIFFSVLRSVRAKRKRSVLSQTDRRRTAEIPQVRVAKMLAVLSATFVILNAPSHITRLWLSFRSGEESITYTERFVQQVVVQFIYYFNFAVKFFLFFSCSKNFRIAFSSCLPSLKTSERNAKTQTETTESMLPR